MSYKTINFGCYQISNFTISVNLIFPSALNFDLPNGFCICFSDELFCIFYVCCMLHLPPPELPRLNSTNYNI
jgi:hypothetical protein